MPPGLVEKRNLRRVPREAFPVHIDTMPASEIDRIVIPMADLAARGGALRAFAHRVPSGQALCYC